MSVQALSWVFENSESKYGARHVLLSIANHADRLGNNSWPSVATIARESHLSETQVHRAIRELVKSGELAIEMASGPCGTNLYRLPKMSQRSLSGTPSKMEPPSICVVGGVPSATEMTDKVAPEPSLREPSKENRPIERARQWPNSFSLTDELKTYAAEKGIARPELEFEIFENYHRSKGNKFVDWKRAWQNWCIRAGSFRLKISSSSEHLPLSEQDKLDLWRSTGRWPQ